MEESYSGADIQILRGSEVVRRRPGMYVGDTRDGTGLEHMVTGVVDWCIEAQRRDKATVVRLTREGAAYVVEHDGDGISVEDLPGGTNRLEVELTVMHGMFSTELPIANGLSSELEAVTHHAGRAYRIRFACGELAAPMEDLGPTTRTGLRLRFVPDATIFGPRGPSPARLRRLLRLRATAHPRMTLMFDHTAFRAPDGAADLARYLGQGVAWHHDAPVRLLGEVTGMAVDVALLWTRRAAPRARWLVNGESVPRGSHVHGVLDGIQKGFAAVDPSIAGVYPAAFREVVFPGLVMTINVAMKEPRLRGQQRECLDEPDVRQLVRTTVARGLAARLGEDDALRVALLARMPRAG